VLLGRWLGVPVACLGRGSDVHRLAQGSPVTRRLARFSLRRASAVGVVADALGHALARLVTSVRATVLPNGVDLARFSPGSATEARRTLGLEAGTRLILYVGRLAPGKGLTTLLRALRLVRVTEPAARLAIVGGGPLARWLVRRVRAAGLAGAVHLAGEVSHDAVVPWLRAADVLVLPSTAEGFPNVVREALACGRPVVATLVGDLPRVVTPAVGRLVPPEDPAALARALVDVLSLPWDAGAIRAHVSGMTWERNGEATARFLAGAIDGSARSGA
jgi:glycosyltransferase involved in cell wall biosynthesis